ncbi:glycosyl hydrolase family 18 protein [Fibrella aquatilis]|uniref:Chitin-binding type-3 domain-containing protein n=1 Tax=Fibrella aquatilis TaxID=2817059 RepID=A0A939G376_9BACT|nr:glycosyl hydrolase family 18 protein [Fibrella aquatilis]MBO0929447.1 hypothetical protein [Fibrella aquatilis]
MTGSSNIANAYRRHFGLLPICLISLLAALLACQPAIERNPTTLNGARLAATTTAPIVLGYFPSWSETQLVNSSSQLTAVPAHVTHLFFAFAKPNLRYVKGSYDLSQTGIEVPYNGQTLRTALAIVAQKGIKVILSLGGETYWATPDAYSINYQQIKDLVDDMGFAGIDWDFEPDGSFDQIGSPANVARFIQFINSSRQLMPKSAGYLIACAPSGAGALGGLNNDDPAAKYAYAKRNQITGEPDTYLYSFSDALHSISLFGFSSTGHMIPVFKAAGSNLDIVAFQGYNTGAAKDRTLMFNAYAWYANQYGFRLAAGTHVPNEPWGPYYTYSAQNTAALAEYIRNGGAENRGGKGDGIMIWQVLARTALPADANYTGVTYLNVAAKVLNGATPAAAIAAAFDYQTTPPPGVPGPPTVSSTSVVVNNPIIGTSVSGTLLVLKDGVQLTTLTVSGTSWSYTPTTVGGYSFRIQTSGGTSAASATVTVTAGSGGGCGYAAYDATKSYPTAGTRVYYNQKIYESKWWINPGDVPNPNDPWGAWKYIQDCAGGPPTPGLPPAPTPTSTSVAVGTTITGSATSAGTLLVLISGVQLTTQQLAGTTWSYTPTTAGSYTFKLQTSAGTSAASVAVTVYTPTPPPNPTGCNAPAYDATKAYPTAGTRVVYNGKLFESKWYINPGQVPDQTDTWGPWKFIQICAN